ncbi:hypothetical protein THRCLA_11124 [Thraustotheca clavata]|uniref:CBM1 domain-containing protein n=1 Tax=Thraustotheca clavata TaxID=74557 RepID=A0A1V9Y8S1_9STRA|nr:hypothetical protein THRCLA_11124 [Thraustotheca clavata]
MTTMMIMTFFFLFNGVLGVHYRSHASDCVQMSVVGDATYCVYGNPCGENGIMCPRKGDMAILDCTSGLASYQSNSGKCIAPRNAVCQELSSSSHVKGCVFPSESTTNMPESTTNMPESATHGPESTTNKPKWTTNKPKSTTNVPESTTNMPELTTNGPESTTSAPESTTTKKPWQHSCAKDWGQCGGRYWTYAQCCLSKGWMCLEINAYYSQCVPPK